LLTSPRMIESLLQKCRPRYTSRLQFWVQLLRETQVQRMVEIGVYQGEFAAAIFEVCDRIERYYLIDPWRHLPKWNKPFNTDDRDFERIFAIAQRNTDFAGTRRVILRGTTTEVIDQIADGELDFAYIDGDHTLRGITIDLVRVYSKIHMGGLIGGDDFCDSIWYHSSQFEPTLVFPFAVYFAEAVGAAIYALPNMQFCLYKPEKPKFQFVDLTGGRFRELSLRNQFAPQKCFKLMLGERFPRLTRIAAKAKAAFR